MHPCFYAARVARTPAGDASFSVDAYFGTRTVEQRFNVAGTLSPAPSIQTFHSLETHVAMITSAGFTLTTLREPHPTPEQFCENPWWTENFTRPLFLLLECGLPGG